MRIALLLAPLALAAALTLGPAAPAGANPAALPRYEAGQTFVFDNGRVERVHAVSGSRITWAARSGRTYERSVNPIVPILNWSFRGQQGARTVQGDPDRLWPLRPGASAQFRTVNVTRDERGRQRRSMHLWTCRVRPAETVALRVGAVQAVPIVCDRYSPSTMRVLERITWHWSDEIGHYVRREARDMRDGVTEVLTLHTTLSPREANPLRIEAVARAAADDRQARG